jgi:phospholipid transport system transporter-binding protein
MAGGAYPGSRMKIDAASLNNGNAAAWLERGLQAIRSGDLAIDLSAVRTVDSAAVALLLGWQRAAQARGASLALAGVPDGIVSLAALYGVDSLLGTGQGTT